MRIAMTLLALALATTGCKKKESEPIGSTVTTGSGVSMTGLGSDTGSAMAAGSDAVGSAAAAGSGDMGSAAAGAGSGSLGSSMTHQGGNCPAMVFGATAKAELKGKDVIVTISATDKDAVASIQRRTDELLEARLDDVKAGSAAAAGGGQLHDRRGSHLGKLGLCPVHIPIGATAKAKKDKTGVVVTITPADKAEELKAEIDTRITKSAEWVKANIQPGDQGNQGGVGGGKGAHGGNHSGEGDSKGKERKGGDGKGGGAGTGGGGGAGTGGGGGKGSAGT